MDQHETLYHRALFGEFEVGNIHQNLERCREISSELSIIDIIDPTSRQIGLLSELLYRMKHMPELEILDINLFNAGEPN